MANHLQIGHGSTHKITHNKPVFHIEKWVATQHSANYCDISNMLKAVIQSTYEGQLLEGVLFLHKTDNPVIRTVEILWQPHSEVLEHPLYSPDLAPSCITNLFHPKMPSETTHLTMTTKQMNWCMSHLPLSQ